MRKIITIIALFASLGIFAQKNVAKRINELVSQNTTFQSVAVLTGATDIENSDTKKAVERATFAKIQMQPLAQLMVNKPENIEVEIPYLDEIIIVQLYQVNPLAEGFHVDTDQSKRVAYNPGIYYRGIIKGDANSLASFSFFNNELSGMISSESLTNLVIGKLDKKDNTSDYIIYSDDDLKLLNSFNCATKDGDTQVNVSRSNAAVLSERCVTMYFEIDNDLYTQNNSDIAETTDWMTSVFNNVQTLFSNDGITISLKSLFIWTEQDPYDGIGDSSSDYLYKFNEIRPVFDGDVGQLVGLDAGGLGGVAVGIDGLCSQNNFSYSDVNISFNTVPTFSWTIMVISHEFGHLLGSPHTHGCHWNGDDTAIDGCGSSAGFTEGDCPEGPIPSETEKGTIMSYCHLVSGIGINFANGFGPQPAAAILNDVNSGTCLSTDCINTCINTIAAIDVSNVTTNTANITWSELGNNTTWQVSIRPFASNTPVWNTVSSPAYTATGLTPNTFYKAWIRPICGGDLISANEQFVFATPAAWCDGITITDTGGPTNEYIDSESYTRVIIPTIPNNKIVLTFTDFSLEEDYDYLYVYDGNSTSATDLSGGGFTGTNNPGIFTSTAADGSLTVRFYSDGGVTDQGYVANIECETLLATDSFVPNIDFTYYPNPTNGSVTITSKTEMSEVFVYNVAGQLLYQNNINDLNTKVDISAFSTGTYFFKLKFADKEANFKIQKQ